MTEFRRWLISLETRPTVITSDLMLRAFSDSFISEGGDSKKELKNAISQLSAYGFRPYLKIFSYEDLEIIFKLGELAATNPAKFYSNSRRVF
jgi:hypothetical protein